MSEIPEACWIVYDHRGIYDRDAAIVLTVEKSKGVAIKACRDDFGGGCVYGPDGLMHYWKDGGSEWRAYTK